MSSALESVSPIDTLILSIVALLVGLFSLGLQWRRHRREERQALDRNDEKREDQARRVAAWVRQGDVGSVELYGDLGNKSDLPIRHASLSVLNDADEVLHVDYYPVVPPGASVSRKLPPHLTSTHEEHYRATVTFTDSNGLRWQRTRSGNLTELPRRFTVFSGVDVRSGLDRYKQLFEDEFGLNLTVESRYNGTALREFFETTRTYTITNCDAIVGPHDWIGDLRAARLLKTVPVRRPSGQTPNTDAMVSDLPSGRRVQHPPDLVEEAFDIFDVGLSSVGVPLAYDTAVLHVNRDVVGNEIPDSIHGIFELGRQHARDEGPPVAISMGETPGLGDPFMMWPILSALGGVLFEPRGDDRWIPSARALESAQLRQALADLHELAGQHPGSFKKATSHARARQFYVEGASPFLIDTVGAIPEMRPGFQFEVCEIPKGKNLLPRPGLSLIYGFFFRDFEATDDVDYAREGFARNGEDFLHYHLSSKAVCKDLSLAMGTPIIWRGGLINADPSADVVQHACCNARPMPLGAGMAAVWSTLGRMLVTVIDTGDVQRSINEAVASLRAVEDSFNDRRP